MGWTNQVLSCRYHRLYISLYHRWLCKFLQFLVQPLASYGLPPQVQLTLCFCKVLLEHIHLFMFSSVQSCCCFISNFRGSLVAQMIENLPAMQETWVPYQDSRPGSGRSHREENGYPLQYSCLENSMDKEAWWATVQGITKSQTQLSD